MAQELNESMAYQYLRIIFERVRLFLSRMRMQPGLLRQKMLAARAQNNIS